MKKLRAKFWKQSKDLIEWCCDEELRVLRSMAGNELESRLKALTSKFDESEDSIKALGKYKSKRKAKQKQQP